MIIRYFLIFAITILYTDCGVALRLPRIVGGNPVYVEQIPYMVNMRKHGTFHCGGSLITPKCVLTAAHCVNSGQPSDIVIRAGVTFLSERRNKRSIKNIFLSPQYNFRTLDMDVAILQLNAPLRGANIQTIELSQDPVQEGALIRVSGWGLTHAKGDVSGQLRSVYLQVLPHHKCRELYGEYRNVTENMFCAFGPGVKDACLADSGGPAVVDNQLAGIVSWGRRFTCARADSPGVYVNISSVKPWIEDVKLKHCY